MRGGRALAILMLLALAGCASTGTPRILNPAAGFESYSPDPRIEFEPGFEAYAERVAKVLPGAITRVEAAHYLPFYRSPQVFVCGTDACFKRYVKTPKLSAAVVPDNRLILSPNLNGREQDRLEPLLVHELSHLHLGQRIGHYHTTLPVWFHEGWASLTANGGGAEYITDAQAVAAIREGRRVDLSQRDTPDVRHRAPAFKLTIYEFYRQSMLLVGWLKYHDEARFRELVLAVQGNQDFEIAFWDVYGTAPAMQLASFFVAAQNGDNIGAVPDTTLAAHPSP